MQVFACFFCAPGSNSSSDVVQEEGEKKKAVWKCDSQAAFLRANFFVYPLG
jgi:hypothetical protein